MTVRRADGRDISLEARAVAQAPDEGDTSGGGTVIRCPPPVCCGQWLTSLMRLGSPMTWATGVSRAMPNQS